MKRGLHEKKTTTIRERTRDNELEIKERLQDLVLDEKLAKKGKKKRLNKGALKESN